MRGIFHPFSHAFPIVLIGLIALSTHLLWAQRTSPLEETAVQLPDAPTPVVTVSDTPTNLHLRYRGLPLTLGQNQDQTESLVQFFPHHTGYDRLPESWGKDRHFIARAPNKWMTFAPAYSPVHPKANHDANAIEYYGHHVPWAGAIIRQIYQQAKAHPHVTSVLKLVHPRF